MMLFDISLYLSLIIFTAGVAYRISVWFTGSFASDAENTDLKERFLETLKSTVNNIFSVWFFQFLFSLFADGLLQIRILKTDFKRWFMHFCIFTGFFLLVLIHVFDESITAKIFLDYQPTLNPFMILRNILGVAVIAGLFFAVCRRLSGYNLKRFSNFSDYLLILLIALIIVSGFLLEAAKIVSEAVFDDMVLEYSDIEDEDEIAALKAYWAKEYSVVFNEAPDQDDGELFEAGLDLHEDTCLSCHSRPESAFGSFFIVKLLKGAALVSNQYRADIFFFYLHFLSTFASMALLPFTKAFHLVSTPISMSLNRVLKKEIENRAVASVKRMAELDACVNCCACTEVCSVGPISRVQGRSAILPSEKLAVVKRMVRKRQKWKESEELLSAAIACTDCYRCNDACPAGIDLRGIWQTASRDLALIGAVEPKEMVRSRTMHQWSEIFEKNDEAENSESFIDEDINTKEIIDNPEFFSPCVQCTTCGNVCPVTAYSSGTSHDEGMSPQQVMNFLRLEMKEMAYVAGLVWNCSTCYMCQENCPQGIPVTEILCELRIRGFKKIRNLGKA